MTTIADVRGEIARILGTIDGWTSFAEGDRLGFVGDQVHTFTFKVSRPAFDPRFVLGESKRPITFTVTAYAPRNTPVESEAALDALCELTGAGSLIATIQTGSNWLITVDYAQVTQCGEVQAITWIDGVDYLACQFAIEVCW